jgi:hypothetical protein
MTTGRARLACASGVPQHCCKLRDAASGCRGGERGLHEEHACAYQQASTLAATLGGSACGGTGRLRKRRTARRSVSVSVSMCMSAMSVQLAQLL